MKKKIEKREREAVKKKITNHREWCRTKRKQIEKEKEKNESNEQEREPWYRKKKKTHTIEWNLKDKQSVWRKHEGRKKRKRKRQKEKMDLKSGLNGRYNNGEKKGSFLF